MAEYLVHKCGYDFVYCSGMCSSCTRNKTSCSTNTTDFVSFPIDEDERQFRKEITKMLRELKERVRNE